MIVVHPDQYVATVLPLDNFDVPGGFFGAFMLEQP